MASGMAIQAHNTSNSSRIMDALKQANQSGALPDSDYQKLVKEHLQQQIDGGKSLDVDLERREQETLKKPTLTDVAAAAEAKGKRVKATRTDGSGAIESVDVVGTGSPDIRTFAKVEGLIPPLRQQFVRDCWAVSTAMMVEWQKQQTVPIEDILRIAGEEYVTMYRDDTGLPNAKIETFFLAMGMALEPPASYTIDAYVNMMNTYGPLWVVTDVGVGALFSPHARVLIEIAGDGDRPDKNAQFTFLDPATGRRDTETFATFLAAYESMMTENKSSKLFLQIVHFKTSIPSSTSRDSTGSAGSRPLQAGEWIELITYKAPHAIVHELAQRDMTIQKIEDAGATTVNLDYYPVKIETFPRLLSGEQATPETLIKYIRQYLNDFVDTGNSSFAPLKPAPDAVRWALDNPLGAVIKIDIFGLDDAAVAVAEADSIHWRFVTLKTSFWEVGGHPVSGTREFGIRGGDTFYTRGADRATGFPEDWAEGFAYSEAKKLWRSLQAKVAAWVNNNGGSATVTPFVQKEENWDEVKRVLP